MRKKILVFISALLVSLSISSGLEINAAALGTFENPYNIKNVQSFTVQNYHYEDVRKASMQVTNVYSGAKANQMMAEAYWNNPVPLNDEQWVIYKMNIKNMATSGDKLRITDILTDNMYVSNSSFVNAKGEAVKLLGKGHNSTINSWLGEKELSYNYLEPGQQKTVYACILIKKSDGIPVIRVSTKANYTNYENERVYSYFKFGASSQPATGLTLNAQNATLSPGKGFQMKGTVTPSNATNKNVTWSSSSPSIATVDSAGNVKAVAPGYTYIYGKTSNGITAKCLVKVVSINPTSVSMNMSKTTLSIGKTFTAKATVYPTNATNKNVTFSSSNTNVVSVDANGTVKTVGAGTAYVKATTANGKVGQILVTVLPNPTSVAISPKSATVKAGTTFKATSTVSPSNAVKNVTYQSSTPAVASVDANGNVKALRSGYTYITVTTHNGKSAKFLVHVV